MNHSSKPHFFYRKASLFVILTMSLFFAGCRENYLAEKEFWKAQKLLNEIKKSEFETQGAQILDPAIHGFQQVFERFPSTPKAPESLFAVSNLYLRQKKYDDAITTLEKIIQNYRDQAPEARNGIAAIYESKGNWKKAEEVYWDIAEYHPFHQRGLYAPIHIILHNKKLKNRLDLESSYARAMEHYRKLIKQTGPITITGVLENYMGLAQLSYGHWRQALKTWNSIATKYPDSPYAPVALLASGELSWRRKSYSESIATYEAFLKKFPKHPMVAKAQIQLGLNFEAEKKYEQSRKWYQAALQSSAENMETKSDIQLLIGKSFQSEGKFSEAEKIYDGIRERYPNTNADLQTPFLQADYYEATNQKVKAESILDSAIERYSQLLAGKDPKKMDFVLRLQNAAYAKRGDWQNILANFDQMILRETSSDRKGNWYFLKGLVAEDRMKNPKLAVEMYQDFIARFPNHSLVNTARYRADALASKL